MYLPMFYRVKDGVDSLREIDSTNRYSFLSGFAQIVREIDGSDLLGIFIGKILATAGILLA